MYHYVLSKFTPCQFARYDVGDFYDYHQDSGHQINEYEKETRKLSMTVQLSEPDTYEGGEFYFYNGHKSLINKTNKLKDKLKKINIVLGFKKGFGTRRWEYYVYAWNPKNKKEDIYNVEHHFKDYNIKTILTIFLKSFSLSKWDQKAYNKFTKKNIIHAIGFDQLSRSAHVVNLYVFPNNVVSDDYPIQTVGYSWNILDFSFILTSYIETHKREDNTFIAALKTFAYKKGLQTYLSLFEKSFYNIHIA